MSIQKEKQVETKQCDCDCSGNPVKIPDNRTSTEHFYRGWVNTDVGPVPTVATLLDKKDRKEHVKIRLSIGRMNYKVKPGIYTVGNPTPSSPVLISCNFKLSFDLLRRELDKLNLWILVIDTNGINVWCAAGKGTFGTEELVASIERIGLKQIVKHRKIILPQLGAPGTAAHEVKKSSGFSVIYGPVRASDIPQFLNSGLKTTPEMRRVRFSTKDRLLLVPVETLQWAKYLLPAIVALLLLSGLDRSGYSFNSIVTVGLRAGFNLLMAHLAGTLMGPVLLPWLPGRRFAVKGAVTGIAVFALSYFLNLTGTGILENLSWFLMMPAYSSFLTMNFTGCSTYTSLSGVKKEMSTAVPVQLIASTLGLLLWIWARFI